jgi:hypothetical protein
LRGRVKEKWTKPTSPIYQRKRKRKKVFSLFVQLHRVQFPNIFLSHQHRLKQKVILISLSLNSYGVWARIKGGAKKSV